ncbi:Sulfotransferase 1C2 [Halotydeus destructor]|nr:Sulfotransferase 1C2 [Halotydeus destructor]
MWTSIPFECTMLLLIFLGVLSAATADVDNPSDNGPMDYDAYFTNNDGINNRGASDALSYRARDDDIFVVTYPKTGTTWVQAMVTLMLNHGTFPHIELDDASPFLEYQGIEGANNMPRPGIIKTHMSSVVLPWNPRAKYVIVTRNPKDQFVSYAYQSINTMKFYENATMADFFELWAKGEIMYGSYFDWHLSWLPYLGLPNILLLTYEDIKGDQRSAINKMAAHIGLSQETVDLHMDQIMEKSSMKEMRKIIKEEVLPNGYQFIRKGVVGGWKSELTDQQSAIVNQLFREKFQGTVYEELWARHSFP